MHHPINADFFPLSHSQQSNDPRDTKKHHVSSYSPRLMLIKDTVTTSAPQWLPEQSAVSHETCLRGHVAAVNGKSPYGQDLWLQ